VPEREVNGKTIKIIIRFCSNLVLMSFLIYISNTSLGDYMQGPSLHHLGEAETAGLVPAASILTLVIVYPLKNVI
jgi:hypothetical protein